MHNYKDYTQEQLNEALKCATQTGDLDEIKFLLDSPDLKIKANINKKDFRGYKLFNENSKYY